MNSRTDGCRPFRFSAIVLGLLAVAAPASAQWTQVAEVPTTELFSIWANGDTIAAGSGTVIYLSTDGGTSWQPTAVPADVAKPIEAIWMRNGRLYTGTFGKGAFFSDDLGATWHAFNEGLVGGFLDSQLSLVDFQVRGDSLYAGTAGAGVYVRGFAPGSTWHHFGDAFEPNQASNVNTLALGGTRLLASAGSNGMVFTHDPGDADWTVSNLDNVGIHAGLQAQSAAWTGSGWVVGTSLGIFRSVAGQEPWTLFDPGLGGLLWTTFATQAGRLFGAFDTPLLVVMEESDDNGATWHDEEVLPSVFVEEMAVSRSTLYAARGDGLWRHTTANASVPPDRRAGSLRFALAGAQPFRDRLRLRFDLPEAETASIQCFDVLGRAVGDRVEGWWSAGPHEVSLDGGSLSPGVYAALITAGGTHEAVRVVHVR